MSPRSSLLFRLLGLLVLLMPATTQAAERPNILWLVCEDSSVNWIGCYGNKEPRTPNIDVLAKQGFRYTHVYACAPVCAPSRSTWITGLHAVSTGTQPMRSRYPIPHDLIKYYPDYLRKGGYYTANHTKTDYNIGGRPDGACWDSKEANAWALRKPGQPFFQVINLGASHESQAQGDVTKTKHSPKDVTLAKYHPDEIRIRQTYAKYHDAVEKMDADLGKALKELEKAGLADETLVIFNSDHGGVLPRSKRFLYDSGIHCPLVIRIPEKYKHLWPAQAPGMPVDRLVSFLDMPKTWLSLAGAEIPPLMQGRVFLGENLEAEPPYVFSFRERMDERYDSQRAVRDKRFVYIKNYMPYVPWGQHLDYLWKMEAMKAWEEAHKKKRTDEITGRFFGLKPVEELYDMQADPDNVIDLADNPTHKQTLERMRGKLREWQLSIHDSGLLPEAERERRAAENKMTIYQMVRDPKLYDLPAYLDAADLALANNPANRPRLIEHLKSPDSALRYWGTVGLFVLGNVEDGAQMSLEAVLNDPCGEVCAMAAWTLIQSGKTAKAQQAVIDLLKQHTSATLMTLNVIDWSKAGITAYVDALNSIKATDGKLADYEQRMVAYLRESRGLPTPDSTGKTGNRPKK
jgi:N-sulfoglucosamine sulfohydrolase